MPITPISKVVRRIRTDLLIHDWDGSSDGELLERFIKQQDEAAFAGLMQRHAAMVWGVCSRVLGGHHDSEDAFQATFLVLVRKASTIVPRDMVANWLHGVAHLVALKARSTSARRRMKERQVDNMPEVSIQHDPWDDLQPLLDQELTRLPNKFRATLILCDLEGKTRKQAAQQLNLPEGTVASRLATARTMLAKRLRRRGFVLSGGALAIILSEQAGSAAAPVSLLNSTIEAASLFAAGTATAAGAIPSTVIALTEGVLKKMLTTKLKTATAAIVAMTITLGGVSSLLQRSPAAGPKIASPVAAASQLAQPAATPLEEADKPHNDNQIVGSGKLVTKEFPATKFTSVDVSAVFQIEITQSDSYKVTVTSDDNVLPLVDVDSADGTLKIALKSEKKSINNPTLKANVAMPNLSGLRLTGACHATLKGIKVEKGFRAHFDGACKLDGDLTTKSAEFEFTGACKVVLKGSAESATIKGSGACHFALEDFSINKANINLNGACTATVNAKQTLDYSLAGACSLHYTGNPKIGRHDTTLASSASHK
jgi:RNA polymerase sigma factor (sigma-70 family)